jgi:hypothetical protein
MLGLTRLPYRARSDGNVRAAVNNAVLQINQRVTDLRRRPRGATPAGEGSTGDDNALAKELELLLANAKAQGWTVQKNSPTTLRLVRPDRKSVHTLTKGKAHVTRQQLRTFAAELRADGLRVNKVVRNPVEDSPY